MTRTAWTITTTAPPYYRSRYGKLYHRTQRIDPIRRGGVPSYTLRAFCGAWDYPSVALPEFTDSPPHVCAKCEMAARRAGKEPSGVPLARGASGIVLSGAE